MQPADNWWCLHSRWICIGWLVRAVDDWLFIILWERSCAGSILLSDSSPYCGPLVMYTTAGFCWCCWWVLSICFILSLRQGLAVYPKLALNSRSLCLSTGIDYRFALPPSANQKILMRQVLFWCMFLNISQPVMAVSWSLSSVSLKSSSFLYLTLSPQGWPLWMVSVGSLVVWLRIGLI